MRAQRRSLAPGWLCGAALLLLALPAAAPDEGDAATGLRRFLDHQRGLAQAAAKSGDLVAVERAWTRLLMLDPHSLEAYRGLVTVARESGDVDAELVGLAELIAQLEQRVATGDKKVVRELAEAQAALALIDPYPGRTALIQARWSEVLADVGRAWLADGWHHNALMAWNARLALLPPSGPEHDEAAAALRNILSEGGDDVAAGGTGAAPPARDVDWIEAHDRKTARWNKAARLETAHYRVKTNAGWEMLQTAAHAMERVHAFYREVWGIVPDPAPKKVSDDLRNIRISPIDLNIYLERDEYLKRSGAPVWSGGVFQGSEVNTYDHGVRGTMSTLFHEASHQFMSEAVGSVPSFVNEGVACLFEGIELRTNGSVRRDLPVMGRLTPLARELQTEAALPLAEVMGGKNANANEPKFYKYRWGIFYFLRMYVDDEGSYVYRDQLEDYIYSFKRGAPGDMQAHFIEWFIDGVDVPGIESFADFERVWQQWIQDLVVELRESDKRLDEYRAEGLAAAADGRPKDALRFFERTLDIDPEDLEALDGLAAACAELGQDDRAAASLRRFLALAEEGDPRRPDAGDRLRGLDDAEYTLAAARHARSSALMDLAALYEADHPRTALHCAGLVLATEPLHDGARDAVARLEQRTGRTLYRWKLLFNGFDLEGWYAPAPDESFKVWDGQIVARPVLDEQSEQGVSDYRTLFLDRPVTGDWSLEATIETEAGWDIVGLCFGARDQKDYDAIVLRRRTDGKGHSVDFGTFSGAWNFRGDGSVRALYDPEQGVVMRITVKGRMVSVSLNGVPVLPIVGGREQPALKYPLGALRGDIGLLVSRGTTRFSDIRLLAR